MKKEDQESLPAASAERGRVHTPPTTKNQHKRQTCSSQGVRAITEQDGSGQSWSEAEVEVGTFGAVLY